MLQRKAGPLLKGGLEAAGGRASVQAEGGWPSAGTGCLFFGYRRGRKHGTGQEGWQIWSDGS